MAEPAAPAAPAPAPAAATPATPAAPVGATGPAPAPAGATAAPADPGNLVAGAKAGEPTPPTLDAVKAFLTEKGAKAEDLAKLDEAGLRAKYDEAQKPVEKPGAAKPEDFAVKAPEGVTVDEVALKTFQETLADAKLSPPERAQRLFDQHQAALKNAHEAPVQLWLKTQTEWQAAVKADAELGGANFDVMQSTIAKAIDSIGGGEAQKAREAFIFTGAGNHPEIVRLMYRMGKALTEGSAIVGDTPAKLGEKADAALMSMYPTAAKPR